MDSNHLSASAVPWLWVTEYIASLEHVDAPVLMNLLRMIPLECADDVGKNMREVINLRILEGLFSQSQRSETQNGDSSEPHSKIVIDPSESCEDVCERILFEMSVSNLRRGAPGMSKWDVQSFIMHKRACLPKPTLQQLKDAILQGSHLIPASLKEKSGLGIRNQSENRTPVADGDDPNSTVWRHEWSAADGQTMAAQGNFVTLTPEKGDGLLREDSPKRNLLPVLATGNQVGEFHESQNYMDNGCDPHSNAAKKLEHDATFTTLDISQNSVSLHGNELLHDSSGRTVEHTGRGGCDLEREPQVGRVEESWSLVDGDDECAASKRQNSDVDSAGLQHKQLHIPCNDNEPQDMSGDGPTQNMCVDDAKDEGKDSAEMRVSNSSFPDVIKQKFCVDEARQSTSNDAPCNEAKDDMEHNCEFKTSSDTSWHHVDKIDIATMKDNLLSSWSTYSQDSFSMADSTELNLCVKCNKSGQLLACSATTCPLMVHKSCLGSAASFDDRGNFYCPFCTYSRAMSDYLKLKKEASLKKKELAAFTGLGIEQRLKKCFKRLQPEQIPLRQDENLDECNEANYVTNYLNEVSSPQCRIINDEQQEEPSASCVNHNLPCAEKGANMIKGILGVSMEDQQEGKEMGQECQSTSTLQGHQIEVQAFHHFDGDESSSKGREIVVWNGGHAEVGIHQDGLQQPIIVSPHVPTCPPNNDAGQSSGEENDKSIASNYYIQWRKQETHYTYPAIPHSRRKKVPWTKMEVDMLKEGVQRFSSVNERSMSWKKVLEFGCNVFKGRTTTDLKDKWRNICKGSSRPK
ncbi:uncharacterized protein LOC132311506 isoform X2 [Cornus florida]|uniref:uncharacterized protein LOC132311506 isoform X2 n=1 Tax=Cornus florida TaxID=4283 RepID=UPI00289E6B9E|nr:uncharacterized protein LOC132311506 isoform X2 [Cornus florida]